MRMASYLLAAAAVAVTASGAFAAAKDKPVSSDGRTGPAPKTEANVTVKPSFGNEAAAPESNGAVFSPPSDFPENGLSTVAHGALGPQPESVIAWDARRRVYTTDYPSRAIVFIEYNGAHLCTGYMYSPNMIATAGHCVHTGGSSGTWYNRSLYKVYPGRDKKKSPYGFCGVSRTHSVAGWTNSGDFNFDYGAMRLNCTIGNTVGWFGLYTPEPLNMPAIISGYPGDKPRDQWTASDKIRAVNDTMIAYRMDTVGGHSGSPVWNDRDEGTATTGAWAFGVHNYGVGAFGDNANSAARLTGVRITNYINWRDAQ